MRHRGCTCPAYQDPFDPYYQCNVCEAVAAGEPDPSCPTCNGAGVWADGDPEAGVQWLETCECVGVVVREKA